MNASRWRPDTASVAIARQLDVSEDDSDTGLAMAAPDCKMQVWSEPPQAFVKIMGRATAGAAPDFIALMDRLRGQGNTCFALELSACDLIDSTFVGHLAQMALRQADDVAAGKARPFILVNPGDHITDVLDTIFVLDLFEVIHDANAAQGREGGEETNCTSRPRDEVNRCCLEAHRVLAALAPENATKFQDVIRFLEQSAAGGP